MQIDNNCKAFLAPNYLFQSIQSITLAIQQSIQPAEDREDRKIKDLEERSGKEEVFLHFSFTTLLYAVLASVACK